MTIQIGELLKCKECGNDFRWIRNSTITPKTCPRCISLAKFDKQREYNKKMLQKSTFNRKNGTTVSKTDKYTVRSKNGKKRLKTAHERFYESTAWKWFSHYVLLYFCTYQFLPVLAVFLSYSGSF